VSKTQPPSERTALLVRTGWECKFSASPAVSVSRSGSKRLASPQLVNLRVQLVSLSGLIGKASRGMVKPLYPAITTSPLCQLFSRVVMS